MRLQTTRAVRIRATIIAALLLALGGTLLGACGANSKDNQPYLVKLKREVLSFYPGMSQVIPFVQLTGTRDEVTVNSDLSPDDKDVKARASQLCQYVLQARSGPAAATVYGQGHAKLAWYRAGDQTCTVSSRFG
jgi:hypothetical protein